jgi:hypothetical protein
VIAGSASEKGSGKSNPGTSCYTRRAAIAAGTLALHAVLGGLLALVDRPAGDERLGAPRVEIVTVEPPRVRAPERPASGASGGGGQATRARVQHPSVRRTIARDDLVTTIEPVAGDAMGGAGGQGRGFGGGIGDGHGLADFAPPAAPVPPPPPAPGPPPSSKARPPRLIYPSRQVQIDDALLFVATLTIDAEGFVDGAHLSHGFGGPRDDQAAGLVWHFRYAPALDDDGRPIRATIEQKFDVGR